MFLFAIWTSSCCSADLGKACPSHWSAATLWSCIKWPRVCGSVSVGLSFFPAVSSFCHFKISLCIL
jgi:hypothetical protein